MIRSGAFASLVVIGASAAASYRPLPLEERRGEGLAGVDFNIYIPFPSTFGRGRFSNYMSRLTLRALFPDPSHTRRRGNQGVWDYYPGRFALVSSLSLTSCRKTSSRFDRRIIRRRPSYSFMSGVSVSASAAK